MVKNDEYEQGVVSCPVRIMQFLRQPKKCYLKEVSVLKLKSPAKAVDTKDGDVIIATAKYGKGTVFAVGDPWLYNEYVDGRKLPAEYENYKAAEDLVKWLLKQAQKNDKGINDIICIDHSLLVYCCRIGTEKDHC